MTAIPPYILVVSSSTSELNNAQNKCLKDWRSQTRKEQQNGTVATFLVTMKKMMIMDGWWIEENKMDEKGWCVFFFVKRNLPQLPAPGWTRWNEWLRLTDNRQKHQRSSAALTSLRSTSQSRNRNDEVTFLFLNCPLPVLVAPLSYVYY